MSDHAVLAEKPLYSPTSFTFDGSTDQALLELFNNDSTPLVWTAKILRWDLDDAGVDHFFETSDFVIESQTIVLPPKSGRTVKIKPNGKPASASEQTYRLLLTTERQEASDFRVTYNHTLPIFLTAKKRYVARSLSNISSSPNRMEISVSNDGSDHAYLETISVRAFDKSGYTLYNIKESGWYILSGRARTYQVMLSEVDCRNQSEVQIAAKFRDGTDVSKNISSLPSCENSQISRTGFSKDEPAL
jgi:P pilus assembly chaperone PapD